MENLELKMRDSFYNYQNFLNSFIDVLDKREILKQKKLDDIILDVVIRRFEFTYEMSWKAIKRYLDFVGIDVTNPRNSFKEAYSIGLIKDENIWLDMINQRNLSSHIYSEFEIRDILYKLEDYKKVFVELKNKLEKELN